MRGKSQTVKADVGYLPEQRKIQRLELFSQLQLLQAYSFCFGSDESIHQVSNDGQGKSAYFKDFQDYVYKPLVVADENTNTQQKCSKLGTVCATPIVAGFFSSL